MYTSSFGQPRPMMMPTLGRPAAGTTIGAPRVVTSTPTTFTAGAYPAGAYPAGAYPAGATVRTVPSTGYSTAQPFTQSVIGGSTVRTIPSTGVPQTVIRSTAGGAPITTSTLQPTIQMPPTYVSGASSARVVSTTPYTLGQYTKSTYESKKKSEDDPQLKKLKDLRKNCGLKFVPVAEALKEFKKAADDDKLNKDNFNKAFTELLQKYGLDVPAESVQKALFELFDRDSNGIVDMMELICGVSLLCQGTEDDKIKAVFEIFDENGDGYISMDEMFKFLTSVFKVVLTPNVMGVMRGMGVEVDSPEDLASVTSLECFKAADLNQDGKLSLTEFQNWFYAPKNDPSFMFSPMRKLLQ